MNIGLISAMVAYSVVLPVAIIIIWNAKKHVGIWPTLCGFLIFIVFALGLEQACHYFCLLTSNPVSKFINSKTAYASIYAALAAGFFEETGRLFAFKALMRKRKGFENAVSYGLGHGGMEMILALGLYYVLLLCFNLGVDFGPIANEMFFTSTISLTIPTCLTAAAERISAMFFHIGASMFVFKAAKEKKPIYYFLMILAHASMDLFVFYTRVGIIPVWAIEGFAALVALATFIDALRICRN